MDYDRKARYLNQATYNPSGYIDIGLDDHTLETFCNMVLSQNKLVRRTQLVNINKLIDLIDPAKYVNDPDKVKKINFIRKGIEARLGFNLNDKYLILQHIDGGVISDDVINIDRYEEMNSADVEFMNNMVSETLHYANVYQSINKIMDICTRFKAKEYGTKGEIVEEFKDCINEVQNDFRRTRNENRTEMVFSLSEETFNDSVTETYNRAANPRKRLITGIQAMNELLGGGFESGRIYTFFGLPGEGKSTLILNLMYQMKKYNRDYVCKDPTKRPCIVLLTMENSVEESIERLFGISTGRDSMIEFDLQSAIELMRTTGELTLNDSNPIDIIIKFKPTNSVDTSYMYTLSDDLEDQGYEVIAFFQDYIGRIRSSQHLNDTRLEYGAVTDDFKTFAQFKDIPVISVSQLNRDASRRIDEGRQTNKNDLVRSLGRSNISESMLILNNIDGGFMLTPEYTNTGEKFMGIQRVKIRYNATSLEIVYLPFDTNGIKLIEDFGSIPVHKISLKPQTATITMNTGMNEIQEISQIEKISDSIFSTSVNSSDDIASLDAAMIYSIDFSTLSMATYKGRVCVDPMEFD